MADYTVMPDDGNDFIVDSATQNLEGTQIRDVAKAQVQAAFSSQGGALAGLAKLISDPVAFSRTLGSIIASLTEELALDSRP